MEDKTSLEGKHRWLKKALAESLQKKQLLEISISEQFEELKKLETSLEKIHANLA